ncbi:tRNA synthetases class I (M)-domain-containing protein [Xylaria nigripes]|nr:tRNA synthetases class I (M)-domain-containing protein [Xylaria nigripes]
MGRLLIDCIRRSSTLKVVSIRPHGWVCQSCRAHQTRPTGIRFSSTNSKLSQPQNDKPYYVTTPIFYVNGSPHVGHLYSMIIADVLKRWEVLKGREAYMSTGTDEHGMKIQRAAELQDLHPKALCDANAETFKDLAKMAHIGNDHFIRTTDPEHRDAVQYFWERLRDSGYIYEKKHEGWYCVSDETFYPATMVEKRMSVITGKSFMASIETGNTVEWTEEKNYHFRLTAFRDRLLQFYRDNSAWLVPESRFTEVIHWVENNLEDLSVSRPSSRLSWGIPVPDDPSQTIYVWLDALVNYITTAGYPFWQPGSGRTGAWPADVHVVGKDIIRFHCIYWPAFLMALNLPLPKRVLSHGHWLMSYQKMSKSAGNVVNPFFALDRWGVDTMRYFLISNGHISDDFNYDNAFIVHKYKKGLQGGLGNLLSRVTLSKKWNLKRAVEYMTKVQATPLLPLVENFRNHLEHIVQTADEHMKALNPNWALKEIMEVVFETNKFFSDLAPWDKANNNDTANLDQIIFFSGESLRIVSILLQPFMPQKSSELLDVLGVSVHKRALKDAVLYGDDSYGTPLASMDTAAKFRVFPPLPVED